LTPSASVPWTQRSCWRF